MRFWFRFCISILAGMVGGILSAQVNSGSVASNVTTFPSNPRAGTPTSLKYTISTIAGTGRSDFSGDNGPAINANLTPTGVAVDTAGDFYIADHDNGRVRKVDPSGTITTVVGGGTRGLTDGLPCTNANPGAINAVTVDSSGNVYFITTYGLFRCDTSGFITVVNQQNLSPNDVVLDSAGNLYVTSKHQVLNSAPPAFSRRWRGPAHRATRAITGSRSTPN